MTRTNQDVATHSPSVTTFAPTATTQAIPPLNVPCHTTYAMTICVASSHRTTRTSVLAAWQTLITTSLTPCLTTTMMGSWKMWTLIQGATWERLDAWKHQHRRGVMSWSRHMDIFSFLHHSYLITTFVPTPDCCLLTHAHWLVLYSYDSS